MTPNNVVFTFLIGGVPFLIFSSSFMIFLSFCSSADSDSSSTSTWMDQNKKQSVENLG